jgi:hypothetical protein
MGCLPEHDPVWPGSGVDHHDGGALPLHDTRYHSVLIVGYRTCADGTVHFLLQNWWLEKQFLTCDVHFLRAREAQLVWVTTPVKSVRVVEPDEVLSARFANSVPDGAAMPGVFVSFLFLVFLSLVGGVPWFEKLKNTCCYLIKRGHSESEAVMSSVTSATSVTPSPTSTPGPATSKRMSRTGLIAVICVVVVIVLVGVAIGIWQAVRGSGSNKGHGTHGGGNGQPGGGGNGPYIPNNYIPPPPTDVSLTPFSDTALQLQFETVPTMLVTQYTVKTIQVPGTGGDLCPQPGPQGPTGPIVSSQTVPQVFTKDGSSQPITTILPGLQGGKAYCTYVQSVGQLSNLGQFVGTVTSVSTGSAPPTPPGPSDAITLNVTYQPPGPAPYYSPPFLIAALSPAQDPTPYTITWFMNQVNHDSGPLASVQQISPPASGDYYATVTCSGPTCPTTPIPPSNTVQVNM